MKILCLPRRIEWPSTRPGEGAEEGFEEGFGEGLGERLEEGLGEGYMMGRSPKNKQDYEGFDKASRARLSRRTLTPGSPKISRNRPSVFWLIKASS